MANQNPTLLEVVDDFAQTYYRPQPHLVNPLAQPGPEPTTPATPEQIERARNEYQTDDVEIDDNATISDAHPHDAGVWVSAWVWLPDEENEAA